MNGTLIRKKYLRQDHSELLQFTLKTRGVHSCHNFMLIQITSFENAFSLLIEGLFLNVAQIKAES